MRNSPVGRGENKALSFKVWIMFWTMVLDNAAYLVRREMREINLEAKHGGGHRRHEGWRKGNSSCSC